MSLLIEDVLPLHYFLKSIKVTIRCHVQCFHPILLFLLEGLTDVIVYGSADNQKLKNRGFSFLEYDSHKSASTAKRKLGSGRVKVWGCDIIVDWADPQEEPDDETMLKVCMLLDTRRPVLYLGYHA